MEINKWFGGRVSELSDADPARARRLLLTGYRANLLALKTSSANGLPNSRRYAAVKVTELIIRALSRPRRSAMVSLFVPCEPLIAAGITPYSVEAVSGYLMGAMCEKHFQETAALRGAPETLCSFHRTFIGAAEAGLLPPPRFIIYTSVACDGNMVTFPHLREKFGVPAFFIDVPYEKSEESVRLVAARLEEMTDFIQDAAGKKIRRQDICDCVRRSRLSAESYLEYLRLEAKHRLGGDVTDEMYAVFMSRMLLGSKASLKYFSMLRQEAALSPESDAARLLWLHAVPYMQPSVRGLLNHGGRAFITACDLCYDSFFTQLDESEPYLSMARRLVYSAFNGDIDCRISRAVKAANLTGSGGAVIFDHMGCKATIGAAGMMRDKIERSGIPTIILDGDACSPADTGDGQLATRLGAFLEMLEARG